ncbi:MAG: hypothetical protein R3194_04645, partial [Limnobacter sp.]|nr:hypothetical protein [Limnobacter sp.]
MKAREAEYTTPRGLSRSSGEEDWAASRPLYVSWFCKVGHQYDFTEDFPAVCMSLFDRTALQDAPLVQQMTFPCLGATVAYIVAKAHQIQCLPLSLLVRLSSDRLSESDIVRAESAILSRLDWKVNPPTLNAYCNEFRQIANL